MPGVGDLIVGGITPTLSGVAVPALQVATRCGSLTWLTVMNLNGSARMLLFLDQVANPSIYIGVTVSPIWAYPVAGLSTAPGTLPIDFTVPPIQFKNGLWIVFSTVLTTPYQCTTTTTNDLCVFAGVNLA